MLVGKPVTADEDSSVLSKLVCLQLEYEIGPRFVRMRVQLQAMLVPL